VIFKIKLDESKKIIKEQVEPPFFNEDLLVKPFFASLPAKFVNKRTLLSRSKRPQEGQGKS
jgi:hypothetical protein